MVIAGASCTLDVAITILDCMQLLTCMQITVAINGVKLQLCVLKQNRLCTVHRRLSYTISSCTIWVHARLNRSSSMMQAACLHHRCDPSSMLASFTWVTQPCGIQRPFQCERYFVLCSLLFTGLSIAYYMAIKVSKSYAVANNKALKQKSG